MIKTRISNLYDKVLKFFISTEAYARYKGVVIGNDCRFVGKIEFGSEPHLIKIGNHVSVTESTFVTHDGGVWVFREEDPTIQSEAGIEIGNNVFIGIGCIVMPGVKIGDDVIVGAGSIVTKNVESGKVVAGVPARVLKNIDDYRKNKKL